MNFKSWLLTESKAITLPPELLNFIDEIAPQITQIMLDSKKSPNGCAEIRKMNKKWNIKVPIQSKNYDKFDYEITGIKYRPVEKYIPVTVVLECNLAKHLGAWSISDYEVIINSFFWGEQRDGSHKNPISIESIKNVLIHEFIHSLDIKSHDRKIADAINRKFSAAIEAPDKSINPDIKNMYYSEPNEQDAHVGTMTQSIISYANASTNHQKTYQDLDKILHFIKNIEEYRNANISLTPLLPKDIKKIYRYKDIGDESIKRRMLSRIYDAVIQAKAILKNK